MNAIVHWFLRAKHWQLFLLLVVVPFVAEVSVITSTPVTIRRVADLGRTQLFYFGVMVVYMVCFLVWLWSMGSFLNSITKSALKLRTGFFQFSLIFPIVYVPVFMLLLVVPKAWSATIILPPHLLAMFCIIYDFYFVSKSLTQVETGDPASFDNFAGPFFLIWFYPIGLWVIQPRINRLYAEGSTIPS